MPSAPACARWLLSLLATLLIAAGDPSGSATHRITIIGASVSDGFGVRLRTATPKADGTRPVMSVDLAALLRAAACDPKDLHVSSYASSQFFLSPDAMATASVRKAIESKSTLVLAIDWLFWSSYGSRRSDGEPIRGCDDRTQRLERALATLQPLVDTGVLIVLGDIPDMRCAVDGGMLTEAMVPDADCLTRLNARIHTWVSTRPNVALLELREVVRRTVAGEPIRACNRDWCATDLGPLLQKDGLHPTLNGSLAVVATALQTADTKTAGTTSRSFDLDPARVRSRLGRRGPKSPTDNPSPTNDAPATAPSEAPPPPPVAADSSSSPSP